MSMSFSDYQDVNRQRVAHQLNTHMQKLLNDVNLSDHELYIELYNLNLQVLAGDMWFMPYGIRVDVPHVILITTGQRRSIVRTRHVISCTIDDWSYSQILQ